MQNLNLIIMMANFGLCVWSEYQAVVFYLWSEWMCCREFNDNDKLTEERMNWKHYQESLTMKPKPRHERCRVMRVLLKCSFRYIKCQKSEQFKMISVEDLASVGKHAV